MGFTITEKILARTAGLPSVKAGDEIMAKPDFVLAYDFPGYTDVIFKQLKNDFGITKMAEPERFGIFIDHMVPAINPAEEELHKGTREWTVDQRRQALRTQGHRPPGLVRSRLRHAGRLRGPLRRPRQPARHLRHAGDRPQAQRARSVRDGEGLDPRAADHPGRPGRPLAARRHGARRVPPHRARARAGVVPLPGARDRRAGGRRHVERRAADDHRPGDVHRRGDGDRQPGCQAPGLRLAARAQEARAGLQRRRRDLRGASHHRPVDARADHRHPAEPGEHARPQGLPRPAGADRLPRLLRLGPDRGPARRRQRAARAGRSPTASSSTSCRPARRSWSPPPRKG